MKHTRGPWKASEHGAYSDYKGNSIVVLGDDLRIASLIAAAPDLLKALEALLEGDFSVSEKARLAIHQG